MKKFVFFLFSSALLFQLPAESANDEPCPTKISFPDGAITARLPGVNRSGSHILFSVRINDQPDDLVFVFDTGAGRPVIDRAVAARIGLQPTEKSSVVGAGAGSVQVDVVKNVSFQAGDLRIDGIDLNIVDHFHENGGAVGNIGYHLLCSSVVTLDYKEPSVTVTAPSAFKYHGIGDVLPLSFRGKWAYVRGTLKVPGVDPVTDDFLIDTGSEDAVNHPIIRQSTGLLHQTTTGVGFGSSLKGVAGPNEWFRIGRTTISASTSVCCAGSDDVNRQLGGELLSRFRLIFNYPAKNVIFEKY